MKLTEREKWLMQQAFDIGINYHGTMDHWLENGSECGMMEQSEYLARYAPKPESIVKVPSFENLPEGEVLATDDLKDFQLGILKDSGNYSMGVVCYAQYSSDELHNIVYYIEIKDIIKMMGDL